jgi:serine/threonine-protein kinase
MSAPPPSQDHEARILGLALLHGYVEAAQLKAAAEEDSRSAQILAILLRDGVLDEPCLHGLERTLAGMEGPPGPAFGPSMATAGIQDQPDEPHATSAPQASSSFGSSSYDPRSGAGLLEQLHIAQWNQYLQLRFVGEGGMGRIFRAFDPALKRTVALKFLRGRDPKELERFRFEAQAQALVDHPNICRVFEVSEWQGQPYIAMKYVKGPTLRKAAPDLDLRAKAELMEKVARALHAAHRLGLVHRDLKPTNILLERDSDGHWVPFVVDFGLARVDEGSGLSVSGLVIGTTAYMAPEQAKGESHRIDRRTDVYGLGATLYELFAGRPPFGAVIGMDGIRRVVEEDPPLLRTFAPAVPEDLQTIVMKCLEKEPDRRYDSAQALAEDLRRFLDGEPVLARPATLAYRTSRFIHRHRPLVAVAGVAAGALILLAGIAGYARWRESARARWAQRFGQEAERIEALVRYTRILPLHDIRQENAMVLGMLRQFEAEAKAAGSLAEAPAAYALGRGYFALGDFPLARRHLDRAWEKGFRTPECSYALARSMALDYQRRMQEVLRIADPAQRLERMEDLERRDKAPLLEKFRSGQRVGLEPVPYYEGLLAWFEGRGEKALGSVRQSHRDAPWFYESKRLEGEILSAQAQASTDPEVAERLFETAIVAFREAQRTAGSDPALHLGEARIHRDRMALAWRTGRDPAVHLEACEQATSRARQADPGNLEVDSIRAWAYAALGRYRMERSGDALLPLGRAIELLEHALATDPSHLESLKTAIFAHSVRGNLLWSQNQDPRPDFGKAIEAAKRAMDLDPGDADVGLRGAVASSLQLLYESYLGIEPWDSFEQGLRLAMRAAEARPRLAAPDASIGMLWACRADCEEKRGLDPAPSVRAADTALRRAIGKAPGDFSYWINLGNAHQTLAMAQINQGADPRPSIFAALQAYTQAHRLNPGQFQSSLYIGMLHYRSAQHLLDSGQKPDPEIAEARAWLAKGRALNPGYWTFAYQSGLVSLLEARGRLRFGGDAEGPFRDAERDFAQALKSGSEAPHWVHAAQAELAEARGRSSFSRGGSPAEDLARGLASAGKALSLNPRYAEGHLRKGGLELLAALVSRDPKVRAERAQAAVRSFQAAKAFNAHLTRACRVGIESARSLVGL